MKAAIYKKPLDIEIAEREEPERGGLAIVKIKAAGICAADIGFYTGKFAYANYPRIGGHELAGIVEYVPENNAGVAGGDRVVIDPVSGCGKCYPCRHGKYNCCTSIEVLGVQTDGGFVEKLAVPVEKLVKIGDMPFGKAVLIEPYTIGYHAVERAGAAPGENVLVMGAGAIGLTIVDQALRLGANVTVADMYPVRLEAAKAMGAETVNAGETDIHDYTNVRTDGEGFGQVFDATGNSHATENCFDIVAPGGVVTIVGLGKDKVGLSGVEFTRREMTILGSRNSVDAFRPMTALMQAGALHPELLLTHRFAFTDIKRAFECVAGGTSEVIKAVLLFE